MIGSSARIPRSRMAGVLACLVLAARPLPASAEPAAPAGGDATIAAPYGSVLTSERVVTTVAPGVYVIRHRDAPDTNPQGNTTVIVGDRDVLVVDSGYLPSSARADIEQIRTWTEKPVHYLLNTHWHPDHVRGNGAYAAAFPGLAILAQARTPDLERGFDEPNLARYPKRLEAMRATLARGKRDDGTRLTDAERSTMRKQVEGMAIVLGELRDYRPVYPTVTFEDRMTIDLGGRVVEISHPGAGHTVGDAIAYLPAEKILIAGDLVTWPVPYFFAGFPYDEIGTLRALATMDASVIVPGHGAVQHDATCLTRTLALLTDARDRVVAETRRRGSLSARYEDVRKAVDLSAYEAELAGSDPDNREWFEESMDGLVKTLVEQIAK